MVYQLRYQIPTYKIFMSFKPRISKIIQTYANNTFNLRLSQPYTFTIVLESRMRSSPSTDPQLHQRMGIFAPYLHHREIIQLFDVINITFLLVVSCLISAPCLHLMAHLPLCADQVSRTHLDVDAAHPHRSPRTRVRSAAQPSSEK